MFEEYRSRYLDLNIRAFAGDPSVDNGYGVRLPRSVVGEERWPAGLAAEALRTVNRAAVYLHLGARHESPQRQPADGMAEVDPDQEAALRRLSLAILNGKTGKPLELAGPSPS